MKISHFYIRWNKQLRWIGGFVFLGILLLILFGILPKVTGEPKIFVLAGGASVYRTLQRKGVPFVTGILQENDVDYPVSKALAERIISQKAFSKIEEENLF